MNAASVSAAGANGDVCSKLSLVGSKVSKVRLLASVVSAGANGQ
jgi:hypothetical protein